MTRKTFFKGGPWFKLNDLGLVLGMTLKYYNGVPKVLKVKVRNFGELVSTFGEVTGEKLVRGRAFWQGLMQSMTQLGTSYVCPSKAINAALCII